MSHPRQYVDVSYKIKDPSAPQRARKAATKPNSYSHAKVIDAYRAEQPSQPALTTPKEVKYLQTQPRNSARNNNEDREEFECIKRKNRSQTVPYNRERIRFNTSGPVLKQATKTAPEESWVNETILGSRSIMIVEQDTEISRYRLAHNKGYHENVAPELLGLSNRAPKDLPVYRNRDIHPNTNGAVLNLPKHKPSTKQNPALLSPRERVVPKSGIIWNGNPVPVDDLESTRHVRAVPDMSREAFYGMYTVSPRGAKGCCDKYNRVVLTNMTESAAVGVNNSILNICSVGK
jgi:hypothetical protein